MYRERIILDSEGRYYIELVLPNPSDSWKHELYFSTNKYWIRYEATKNTFAIEGARKSKIKVKKLWRRSRRS